jgi:hypothetical protein
MASCRIQDVSVGFYSSMQQNQSFLIYFAELCIQQVGR